MRITTIVLFAAVLLAAPSFAQEMSDGERLIVRIENPADLDRPSEVVELDWAELQSHLPALAPERARVRDAASGSELPVQVFDADADGTPDELLVLAAFRPEETRVLAVEAAPAAEVEPRAYTKHVDYRDDMAWENDRIAFRTYGEGLWEREDLVSSGIDVWLKRTPAMILDPWYEAGHDAYHVDTGEGADFFGVGPSLGAGGTALWRDGQMYRAPNFAAYRIVADGPLRAVFEMDYGPWDAGGVEVTETKRITLDAGEQLFRSESTFETDAPADALTYVTGLIKHPDVVGSMRTVGPHPWLSTWAPVVQTDGGHGDLGTAVLLPDAGPLQDVRETDDHYLMLLTSEAGAPAAHYAGAAWTAAGTIEDVETWWDYLETFAQRLDAPLHVMIEPAP